MNITINCTICGSRLIKNEKASNNIFVNFTCSECRLNNHISSVTLKFDACNSYYLPFIVKNDMFLLYGNSNAGTNLYKTDINIKGNFLHLIGINFIPIKIYDNTSHDTWKIFNKLRNLSIFS